GKRVFICAGEVLYKMRGEPLSRLFKRSIFLIQSGDEPFITESIRKPKIEGRSPRNEKYSRSP
ncbi:MAG TPA: hypothetical protein PKG97_02540, partial [Mesotoga infera]|nr:hypothetical protein [Mesotoga infera]